MHQQTLALLPDKEAEAVDLNYLANKLEESTSTIRARLKRLGDFGFVNWSKNLETTKKYVYYKTYHAYQGLTIDLPWPDFEDYLLKSIDLPSYLLYYITKGDKETINRIIAPLNDTECDIWNGVKVGKSLSKIDEDREPKPVKIESETSVVSPRQVLGKSIDERKVE